MALEGTDISFTITNTTGEKELFYWAIKPTVGSLREYDFIDPPSKLFESTRLASTSWWEKPSVSLNDGESITISLSLSDDKAVEPNHTFEIISKTDARNAEEETIATFTIEDAIPPLITTNTSSLFPKIDGVGLGQSPGGKFILDKNEDFPFAIYIIGAEQDETWTGTRIKKAFYISNKNALIQYEDSENDDESNGQIFYTSKDSNGTFQKTITFDPIPELYGYNSEGMTSFDFDANNNFFSIHSYTKKSGNIPGEYLAKRLSSHDSEGNLLWTKSINGRSFGLTSDSNGGIIIGNSDSNENYIFYSRLSANDGSLEWVSQPYAEFSEGSLRASDRSIQILDDNSFLAVTGGFINTLSDNGFGTNIAKLSLEDGSIQSLLSEVGGGSYWSHAIFNSDGTIYLRTNSGSHEINAGANPIAKNFPNFQASDITAPTLAPNPAPGLLPNDIATLDANDISRLSTSAISSLTNEQVVDLSPAAMQGFSSTKIAALQSDAVAELSIKQVKQLLTQAVQGLSPKQIAALSPKTIKGFSPDQIEQLPKRTFKALDTDQLAKLSNDAITGLTTAQLKTLSGDELSVFKPRQFKAIDSDAISGLKPKSLNALRQRQARAFSDDQLAALSKKQIKKADVFIDHLNPKQSDALSFDTSRSNRLVDLTAELNDLALNSSIEILA